MAVFQPYRFLLSRKALVLVTASVLASLSWLLHFILEFIVLSAVDLAPIYILFHLAGLPIGALLFLFVFSKHDQTVCFLVTSSLLNFSLIGLVLVQEPIFVLGFLALAGVNIGIGLPLIFLLIVPFLEKPEYNGRIYYSSYIGISLILILEAIVIFMKAVLIHVLFLGTLLFIILITFLLGRSPSVLPPRRTNLRSYLQKDVFPFPAHFLTFFLGFFFTNGYYAAILILSSSEKLSQLYPYPDSLNVFILILYLICLLFCVPSGILYDWVGRRWPMLIGFYLTALLFFIIPFRSTLFPYIPEETLFLLIIPIILGLGITLAIFGGFLVVNLELAPKEYLSTHIGIIVVFVGVGEICGVIANEVLKLLDQPFLLPVVMIFASFTATMIVFQIKEPLPSRAELEWRRKVEHILVLSKSGLPLYSQPLQHQELEADAALAGGAIIGVSGIINEITRASNLKVIKQENYCIMLEESSQIILAIMVTEELETVRTKMQDFVVDFESFFEELLHDWTGSTIVFRPTKKLVEKHFG